MSVGNYYKVHVQLAPERRHRFYLSTFIAALVVPSLTLFFVYFSTSDINNMQQQLAVMYSN